jgi:hypothetical protein
VDGAQQIDGGSGMSAPANGTRALNSVKSALKRQKRWSFEMQRVKSHYLKIDRVLLQFEVRCSDHP